MPDMTMCKGGKCPLRWGCFRFIAESFGRQDYYKAPPFLPNGTCTSFIDAARAHYWNIDVNAITMIAEQIYKQNPTYEECIWLLAVEEHKLAMLAQGKFAADKPDTYETITPDQVEINLLPSTTEQIAVRAYFLGEKMPHNLQDLHWYIAERRLLYPIILNRIKSTYLKYGK